LYNNLQVPHAEYIANKTLASSRNHCVSVYIAKLYCYLL